MQDFRTVKDMVKRVVAELKEKDPNWSWRADVLKSEIRIWWGYLQYCDTKDSHFTIRMANEEENGGVDYDDFVVAVDEHNCFMFGALIGDKSWQDGDLSKCVELLLKNIANKAHRCY